MKSNPLKNQFIRDIKSLLEEQGIDLDPLELKKKLEKDIGPMSYNEAAEYITSSLRSQETYEETRKLLQKLQEKRGQKTETISPNVSLIEGASPTIIHHKRQGSFWESPVETQVIRREKG